MLISTVKLYGADLVTFADGLSVCAPEAFSIGVLAANFVNVSMLISCSELILADLTTCVGVIVYGLPQSFELIRDLLIREAIVSICSNAVNVLLCKSHSFFPSMLISSV